MVESEEVYTAECEECSLKYDEENPDLLFCDNCESVLCEQCFEHHSIECFQDSISSVPEDRFTKEYVCGECGEYYEIPEEAEDCCKEG